MAARDLFSEEAELPDVGPNTTIARLREEAADCTRCHLYKHATQTVFGEGPSRAEVVMVGEQPGDQEDLQGKPFVGPAGKLLDRAMEDAGVDRSKVYVTNAVKHFKFEPRGFQLLITIHPSMILRVPDEADKRKAYADFVRDLKKAA